MKEKNENKNLPVSQAIPINKNKLPGYPLYPDSEDIYNQSQKEQIPELEDTPNTTPKDYSNTGVANEFSFSIYQPGGDLDVPGSELDDEQENIGNEDEENNYYSLGGDDHNDLDENKGD